MERATSRNRFERRSFTGAPLQRVAALLSRHLLLAAGVPALLVLGTLAFLLVATPIYEASTSIRIDERRTNVALFEVLRTLSAGSQVETEMEVLRSRTLAEEVVDSLDLDVRIREPGRVRRGELFRRMAAVPDTLGAEYRFERAGEGVFRVQGEVPVRGDPRSLLPLRRTVTRELGTVRVGETARLGGLTFVLAAGAAAHDVLRVEHVPFDRAVRALRKELSVVRPVREASLVVVRYEGRDPALVPAVPNLLARRFMAARRAVHGAEARSTVHFLEEQLDTLSRQLAAAEEALRAFRERNRVVSVAAEADAQIRRLAELRGQRDMVDAERAALARLLADVETAGAAAGSGGRQASPYRRLIAFPTLLRNPAASELLRVLAGLENERSELFMRRTLDDPDVVVLAERIAEVEDQLRSIGTTYLQGLENQVASLDAVLAQFQEEVARIPAKDIVFARLSRETGVLGEIYALLRTRIKEAEIAAAVEDVSVRVVDPAIQPRKPVKPRPLLSLVLALLLGAVLGVGSAFALEYADTSIQTREALQGVTGVPVLGLVPALDGVLPGRRWGALRRPSRAGSPLLLSDAAGGPLAEAFRTLRANLAFLRQGAARSLVITSPTPGEGKSTTAANLAVVMAQQGQRVLLVDGDLRGAALHGLLGTPGRPGLSDVIAARVPVEEAIREVPVGGGRLLGFLAAGEPPADPTVALDSPVMKETLERLKARYEMVIVDAPPLDAVVDAAILGSKADGVILVAQAGEAEEGPIAYAMEQLDNARAPVLGTVLNGVDPRRSSYFGWRGARAGTTNGAARAR